MQVFKSHERKSERRNRFHIVWHQSPRSCLFFSGVNAGHYTCYVKNPCTHQWQYCNDEVVSQQEPSEQDTANVYILFYSRKGLLTVHLQNHLNFNMEVSSLTPTFFSIGWTKPLSKEWITCCTYHTCIFLKTRFPIICPTSRTVSNMIGRFFFIFLYVYIKRRKIILTEFSSSFECFVHTRMYLLFIIYHMFWFNIVGTKHLLFEGP